MQSLSKEENRAKLKLAYLDFSQAEYESSICDFKIVINHPILTYLNIKSLA